MRHPQIALLAAVVLLCALSLFAADNPAVLAGAALFRDKGCSHCHGEGAIGGKKAPALLDIYKDKQWTPAKITGQIMNGGQKMPPFGDSLTDPEIAQLVAYLRSRHKPVPPGPAN